MVRIFVFLHFLFFLNAWNAGSAYDHEDVFAPLVFPEDPTLESQFCTALLEAQPNFPHLEFQAYDYLASNGTIVDDSGFLLSVRWVWGPRKIIIRSNQVQIVRQVSLDEIDVVRNLGKLAVIQSYESHIQPEIKKAVEVVETELDPNQVSFGIVRDTRTDEIVGMIRVVHAHVKKRRLILPALEILRKRDLMDQEDEEKIAHLLGSNSSMAALQAGYDRPAKEVGQFYIKHSLSSGERTAVREQLLMWLVYGNLKTSDSNALVFAHSSLSSLEEKWRVGYGFDIPVFEKEKSGVTEYLRATSAGDLFSLIKTRLRLP